VPVIVRNFSEDKKAIVTLIENVQRADLNPIEEATAYKRLQDILNLSQDEVASRVGKNRSTVANAMRLLKLPWAMQESIQEGDISPGHARAILSVPSQKGQETLYQEILKKNLSVREAEKRAAALAGTAPKAKKGESAAKFKDPELAAMEDRFLSRLGTKVKISGSLEKGVIEIDYYSMDDLQRLYDLIGGP
jgi:ParB family chromosome partitioning protein